MEAIGSLSHIALITLLRYFQDPDLLDYPGLSTTMNDNLLLAAKLLDALNTSMTMSIIYKIL
jgi:hypothetical protein